MGSRPQPYTHTPLKTRGVALPRFWDKILQAETHAIASVPACTANGVVPACTPHDLHERGSVPAREWLVSYSSRVLTVASPWESRAFLLPESSKQVCYRFDASVTRAHGFRCAADSNCRCKCFSSLNVEAVVTHIERFENSVAAGACCDLHATPFKPVLVKSRFNETLATAECIGKSLEATLSDVIAAEEEALHV